MEEKKRKMIFIVLSVVALAFIMLFLGTGFLQESKIDARDLVKWDHSEDGIIDGAEAFFIEGDKETCWLLIHGYSSTPKDFKALSEEINLEFGDYVEVPRLKGHGMVPSEIVDLSFEDWYSQVEKEFNVLENNCGKVNIVGFSLGGVLSLKLAENHEVNNLYLLSPFLILKYEFWHVFSKESFIKIFSDKIGYIKKLTPAKVNSPEGSKKVIAYFNLPLAPLIKIFLSLDTIIGDLDKINNPILVQHSTGDEVIDMKGSKLIYERVSSSEKELIIYEKSNHVLTFDYDKEEVVNKIIEFERNHRL